MPLKKAEADRGRKRRLQSVLIPDHAGTLQSIRRVSQPEIGIPSSGPHVRRTKYSIGGSKGSGSYVCCSIGANKGEGDAVDFAAISSHLAMDPSGSNCSLLDRTGLWNHASVSLSKWRPAAAKHGSVFQRTTIVTKPFQKQCGNVRHQRHAQGYRHRSDVPGSVPTSNGEPRAKATSVHANSH